MSRAVTPALFDACDVFARLANIIDALPPGHKIGNDCSLRDQMPGVWPNVGDVRRLRDELVKCGWTNDHEPRS